MYLNPSIPTSSTPTRTATEPPSALQVAVQGGGRGFAAGVAATAAMSVVMLAAQRLGFTGRLPPKKITDAMLSVVGVEDIVPSSVKNALTAANHFAFGGACGALFGLGHALARRGQGAAATHGVDVGAGLAFGTFVWAVSYAGWVPAVGIMPPPQNDRPGRPASMVIAHWVYGAVLAKLVARSAARGREN